jgi:pimeloyl-ACP methyl ester carboxylesterase
MTYLSFVGEFVSAMNLPEAIPWELLICLIIVLPALASLLLYVLTHILWITMGTLMREIGWALIHPYAALFHSHFPVRSTIALPDHVRAIGFPGLGADSRQLAIPAGKFPSAARLLNCQMVTTEPSDTLTWNYMPSLILLPRINIGQESDVKKALADTRRVMANNGTDKKKDKWILYGVSRGAAVALQVAALLTEEEIKRVSLVILEGVFTNAEDVLDSPPDPISPYCNRFMVRVFTKYRKVHNDKWSPLAAAKTFPHRDLPIVIATSLADEIVLPRLGKQIGKTLRDAGVKHVHEIELQNSAHAQYAWGNDADRETYVNGLNVAYEKFVIAN